MSTTTERVQHTPGPWMASRGMEDEPERWDVLQNTDEKHYIIATIENGAPGDTMDTEAANANLIAAAPELLAELKAMHEHHHPDCQGGCPTLAIIAKAKS